MKYAVTIAIVLSLAALGAVFFYHPAQSPTVGAAAGPDVTQFTHFMDNVNVGGYDYATSSAGASTYPAAVIAKANVIEQIATGALTVTLPTNAALSSVGFLPNVGDSQEIFIQASTTKITLAGNTGVTLDAASTTTIYPGHLARIQFVRLGATEGRLIHAVLVGN